MGAAASVVVATETIQQPPDNSKAGGIESNESRGQLSSTRFNFAISNLSPKRAELNKQSAEEAIREAKCIEANVMPKVGACG
jgi:hypothetical protein